MADKISKATKLAYGFGMSAEGIKNNTFNVFLLFYYQQIVGLSPALCGLALFVALLIDAITDPLVGVWSDAFQSRLGRRLPFMYAASVPLALCFIAVFHPPGGLGQLELFLWLTFFASSTRFAMTLFVIPHQSLVAELSSDYDERTSLQTIRTIFGWIFGLLNVLIAFQVFLRATPEYPQGLLNPAGYAPFAVWGAAVILVATFISTAGVHRAVLASAAAKAPIKPMSLRAFPRELAVAFKSPAYRVTVLGGLLLWIGFGLTENTRNYMNTFFWGFTSEQISGLVYVLLGSSATALLFAPRVAQRLGKRAMLVAGVMLFGLLEPLVIVLRLLGLLPENGDPALLPFIMVIWYFAFLGIITAMIMVGAMIADITDEHELRTGARQEGLLFSAYLFMNKAASGGGVLLAGLMLQLARFPQNGAVQASPESVTLLGIFSASLTVAFMTATAWFFSRYRLDRTQHSEILAQLAARRTTSERPGDSESRAAPFTGVAPAKASAGAS